MSRNLFITFYRRDNGLLKIFNGFSFVRHLIDADDVFIDEESETARRDISKRAKDYDNIFVSLSFNYQYRLVRPLLTNKWVLGGPAIGGISHIIDKTCHARFVKGFFEIDFLGMDKLSSTFTDYWRSQMSDIDCSGCKNIHYACTIERGCYWNKCKFCHYYKADASTSRRPAIGSILAQIKTNPNLKTINVHLGTSSISIPSLQEVVKSPIRKYIPLRFFARADKGVARILGQSRNNKGILCSLGVEVPSQKGAELLNKQDSMANILSISESVLSKGGVIEWNLMDGHVFLNDEILSECLETLNYVQKNFYRYRNRFRFYNNGRTAWPEFSYPNHLCDIYGGKVKYKRITYRDFYFIELEEHVLNNHRKMHDKLDELRQLGFIVTGQKWITSAGSPRWENV